LAQQLPYRRGSRQSAHTGLDAGTGKIALITLKNLQNPRIFHVPM